MRLFEIKVTPYPYTIHNTENSNYKEVIAKFTTQDGGNIKVTINAIKGYDCEVSFSRDGTHQATGTGDQYRILFTVVDVIDKYLADAATVSNEVIFTADQSEPSRVKLYKNRLAPRMSTILGTEWTGPKIINEPLEAVFVWKRINQLPVPST